MIDRDTIIKLAREAHWATAHGGMPTTSPWWDMDVPALEHFAALVAAAEREACAQVCDARYMGDNTREDMEARRCAAAIRARGNT